MLRDFRRASPFLLLLQSKGRALARISGRPRQAVIEPLQRFALCETEPRMSSAGTVEWAVFAALVAGLLVVGILAGRWAPPPHAWLWGAVWVGGAPRLRPWRGARLRAPAWACLPRP